MASKRQLARATSTLDVLTPNWKAVQVFQRCQWEIGFSMAGMHWLGIRTTEIRASAQALKYRLTRNLLDRVRVMQHAAERVLNESKKKS
jgi:hypothetical protein